MNLVAEEYIAAQNPGNPGVLVLSQFAGAAADLREALIMNPYGADEVAAEIDQAIRMTVAERQERHIALLSRIHRRDVVAWHRAFLTDRQATGDARAVG